LNYDGADEYDDYEPVIDNLLELANFITSLFPIIDFLAAAVDEVTLMPVDRAYAVNG